MTTSAMPIPGWLRPLAAEVATWLDSLRKHGHPGWIRFCAGGAFQEPGPKAGLAFSCLGLKLVRLLNMDAAMRLNELETWVSHIQSFQRRYGLRTGYFEDRLLLRHKDHWFHRDLAVRRGETRQAFVALLSVDRLPKVPLPVIATDERAIRRYIRGLPWDIDPWGAGSHASLLIVFLEGNARGFGRTRERDQLLPVVLEELSQLQDPMTGCWTKGSADPDNILNGAMKVLSGYAFLDRPFPFCERIIDFALSRTNDRDACHHVDVVYVLHQCAKRTDYRSGDIARYALARIEQIRSFRKADGGFSFHYDHSGTHYYGVRVAEGKPVSDIHGTKLMVWALVMLADILGWREELRWKLTYT